MEERINWSLLILYMAGENGLTPVQLQKTIFLLQKAFPGLDNLDFNFRPYNYGPFDVGVYQDVEYLLYKGLGEVHKKNGSGVRTYYISRRGTAIAKKLNDLLDSNTNNYLLELVNWVQSLSFQDLVSSIYKKYPEYKENSIFKS